MDSHDDQVRRSRRIPWALGIALALLLWISLEIVLLAFAGILLAVFIKSIADFTENHLPVGYTWAYLITVILLIAASAAAVLLMARPIAAQASQLLEKLPASLQQVEIYLGDLGLAEIFSQLPGPVEYISSRPDLLTRITGIFSSTLGALVTLAVVLFLGLYMAFNPGMYVNGIVSLIPPESRPGAHSVLGEAGRILQWWLIGRLIAMMAVGVIVTLGLWALGVPLALVLGIIAAALDFVPYVGPVIAFVPAFLIAMMSGLKTAALVALLYLAVQSIESYVITPLIQQKTVDIPPALNVLVQVLLGIVAGGLGVVLATPLTAVMLVFVKRLYIDGFLEKRGG